MICKTPTDEQYKTVFSDPLLSEAIEWCKGLISLSDLARGLDVTEYEAREAVDRLKANGFVNELEDDYFSDRRECDSVLELVSETLFNCGTVATAAQLLQVAYVQGGEATARFLDLASRAKATGEFSRHPKSRPWLKPRLRSLGDVLNGAEATEGIFEPMRKKKPKGPRTFRTITCQQMANDDSEEVFLVDGVLVENQPMMIGGMSKTLKTSLMVDLALSLATGTRFLNTFDAIKCRVALMSAESGIKTLRAKAEAICKARSVDLADINTLIWSDEVPNLMKPRDRVALHDWIVDQRLDVLAIDPTYLALPAAEASSVFSQGETLGLIAEICRETNTTLILLHHAKKTINRTGPIGLNDLSGAGFAEFVRQWFLISRRSTFVSDTGTHELWITLGGSAGHSAEYALDIFEGVMPSNAEVAQMPALKRWRRWDVELNTVEQMKAKSNRAKAAEQNEARNDLVDQIRGALHDQPDGMFKKEVAKAIGVARTGNRFLKVWDDLIDEGQIQTTGKKFTWSGETKGGSDDSFF